MKTDDKALKAHAFFFVESNESKNILLGKQIVKV